MNESIRKMHEVEYGNLPDETEYPINQADPSLLHTIPPVVCYKYPDLQCVTFSHLFWRRHQSEPAMHCSAWHHPHTGHHPAPTIAGLRLQIAVKRQRDPTKSQSVTHKFYLPPSPSKKNFRKVKFMCYALTFCR